MSPERRVAPRVRKRLLVKYGESELNRTGYTSDISTTGMFITATSLPGLDTRAHFQVFYEERFLYFEGMVQRHKITPAGLSTVERGGFGVRFLRPDEAVNEMLHARAKAAEQPRGFRVQLPTRAALEKALLSELRLGTLFVRTTVSMPRDTITKIEFVLPFTPTPTAVAFPARVTNVVVPQTRDGKETVAGIAFEFLEKDMVLEALTRFLAL